MIDLRSARRDHASVRRALSRRGAAEMLDAALALDERRRGLIREVEERRSMQNRASESIAEARRAKRDAAPEIAAMREVATQLKDLERDLASIEAELDAAAAEIPNPPDPTAPDAEEVVRVVGDPPAFDFEPKDHLDLGTALDVIDMERGARTSGSRFAYLKGDLVLLELALVQHAIDVARKHGFRPVVPPVLVREEAMFDTGFLPTDRAQIYETAADDLFLVGTAEVPLASLHAREILEEAALPVRYVGFSPCFRREAGAAGRDTRGIFRVHQFDKVEMFVFCHPDRSGEEHERLLAIEEEMLRSLDIPYRVVNIPVDDLGAPAAKKYDCEAWLPGQDRYRELTSCSNTTDYQARRLGCRFRPERGQPRQVHTLNGTVAAIGRTIVAIMENHQRADGTIDVPPVLCEYGAPARIAG